MVVAASVKSTISETSLVFPVRFLATPASSVPVLEVCASPMHTFFMPHQPFAGDAAVQPLRLVVGSLASLSVTQK